MCWVSLARIAAVTLITILWTVLGLAQEPLRDAAVQRRATPRLVLQITVDQLRGDLLTRHYEQFGQGGFRYLLDNGVVYGNAHHAHANTETIVGHTTLATGAHPSEHGMVANVWFDRQAGKLTYNIEDRRFTLLTTGADVSKETEIDPTQKKATAEGRSPAAILVSTFADELAIRTAGRAKIFGVSVKDRGAVSMAGHAGKAFWFSKANGEFVTSSYYYKQYPEWVVDWNKNRPTARYAMQAWELLRDKSTYQFASVDDRPWEINLFGYRRTFPHPYGKADSKPFTTLLTISPAGDELTLDFAKTLIEKEGLGKRDVPDYLAVSFSSTDYVGHFFGPSSLESEDNLLRLDRTLAQLFEFVDKHVGLRNTLIVLSADHGAPEVPAYLNWLGIIDAKYIKPEAWDKEAAIGRLKKKFGIGKELIQTYFHPYVYLNRDAIAANGLDQAAVERAVASELEKFEGVALAVPSSQLRNAAPPNRDVMRAVLNNFNPHRSGDIYIVFKPHWFVADFDGVSVAASHGSPWRYDTFVPIIFAGNGLKSQRIFRRVHTIDVAPTLAALLGAKPPSGSAGDPLPEVMADGARD